MARGWYCKDKRGVEIGPISFSGLRQRVYGGTVRPDTPVRDGADADWVAAKDVPGLMDSSQPASEPPSGPFPTGAPDRVDPPVPSGVPLPPPGQILTPAATGALPGPLRPGGPPVADEPPFDPYYTWLGIPPEEQPPHHYRLLGIRPLEDNPDVIENAADRQMAHLRSRQAGKHSAWSQKLLNDVALAKVCLLNPDRKALYDRQLCEQFSSPMGRRAAALLAALSRRDTLAILAVALAVVVMAGIVLMGQYHKPKTTTLSENVFVKHAEPARSGATEKDAADAKVDGDTNDHGPASDADSGAENRQDAPPPGAGVEMPQDKPSDEAPSDITPSAGISGRDDQTAGGPPRGGVPPGGSATNIPAANQRAVGATGGGDASAAGITNRREPAVSGATEPSAARPEPLPGDDLPGDNSPGAGSPGGNSPGIRSPQPPPQPLCPREQQRLLALTSIYESQRDLLKQLSNKQHALRVIQQQQQDARMMGIPISNGGMSVGRLMSEIDALSRKKDADFQIWFSLCDQYGQWGPAVHQRTIGVFDSWIETDGGMALLHLGRGIALIHVDKFDVALTDLDLTARLDPRFQALVTALSGFVLARQGQPVDAAKRFDDSARMITQMKQTSASNPTEVKSLERLLGIVFVLRGYAFRDDYPAAEDALKKAVVSPRDGPEGYEALGWLYATCPRITVRNGGRAVNNAMKAYRLLQTAKKAGGLPGDGDWHYLDTLGAAYAESGDFESAVKYASEALTLVPREQEEAVQKRLASYRSREAYHAP